MAGITTLLRLDKKKSGSARITVEGSGAKPHAFAATGVEFRIVIFDALGNVLDLTDHSSLTLAYMPEARTGSAIAAITASIEDATFTEAQFQAGTHYHAAFIFDESDLNPTFTGNTKDYWMICSGIATATGDTIVHGGCTFTLEESGYENSVDPPDAPEVGITSAQASTLITAAFTSNSTVKNKINATTAPTTGDDTGDGYSAGSLWVDVTNDRAYVCLDATSTAAVWTRIDNTASLTNKLDGTTAPTTGDDTGDGYSVGSLWIDTTNDRVYVCVDATSTAAVWLRVDNTTGILNKLDGTTAPTTGDDTGDGYSVGSLWVDTTNDRAYLCVDATSTAAVWVRLDNATGILNKLDGTTAPTTGDDTGDGYSVGSLWVDTTNDRAYICADATSTAAVWLRVDNKDCVVEDTSPQLGGTLETNAKQIRESKGVDVASGTTLTLGNDGNYFDITGTTTITGIATKGVGTLVGLHFDGVLTLTHHATDLILPGGANITTAAGDEAFFREYATGDWRCVGYTRASGAALALPAIPNYAFDATPTTFNGFINITNAISDTYHPQADNNVLAWANAGGGWTYVATGDPVNLV